MKKIHFILALTFFHLGLVQGQIYEWRGFNPFGLYPFNEDTSDVAMRFDFYDVDRDGDLDVIVTGIDTIYQDKIQSPDGFKFFMAYQENIGNRWSPSFAKMRKMPLQVPPVNGAIYPAIGDLNDDQVPDFIICCKFDQGYNISAQYWESQGSINQYKEHLAEEIKLQKTAAGSFYIPSIYDMDKDGDLDILMSGSEVEIDETGKKTDKPNTMYAKNVGTPKQPLFEGWYKNTNGIDQYFEESSLFFPGDLDLDGDVDLLSMFTFTEEDTLRYFSMIINEPLVNNKANFVSVASILGLPVSVDDRTLPPTLADLDGDGDLDIVYMENMLRENFRCVYYENTTCTGHIDNKVIKTGSVLKANAIGMSYQWIDCTTGKLIEGANQQSFVPSTSGRYAVRLRDNKGCENISSCEEVVISGTDDQLAAFIDLGPSPAKDHVWIRHRDGNIIDQITVLGEEGRVVLNKQNASSNIRLDLTGWSAGVYLVEIRTGNITVHKKLIVVP